MSKLNLDHTLRKRIAQTLTKTTQKESIQLFPPLHRNSVCKDETHIRDLMKSERFYIDKVIHPALKQIDCSRIQNLRFTENMQGLKDLKPEIRSQRLKESKCLKQNKPNFKNISKQKEIQKLKMSFVLKLEQNEHKKSKISYFEKKKMNTQQIDQKRTTKSIKACLTQRGSKIDSKEKISGCRVATKKEAFPFSTKQYQNLKLRQQFEQQEQKLSVIPRNAQQQMQKFISFQSYAQLLAF